MAPRFPVALACSLAALVVVGAAPARADEGAAGALRLAQLGAEDPAPPADEEMSASLTVSADKPGHLFLDGQPTGFTTPAIDLTVTPGSHVLEVRSETGELLGRLKVEVEPGGALNVHVPSAAAAPVPVDDGAQVAPPPDEGPAGTEGPGPATPGKTKPAVSFHRMLIERWRVMAIGGWTLLATGTVALVMGALILSTPNSPFLEPFGFGAFGTFGFGVFGIGAGFAIGGGVLLYLDSEFFGEDAAADGAPVPTSKPAAAEG